MKMIGKFQGLDEERRPGSTIIKLVLNVGNVMTTGVRREEEEQEEEEEEEEEKAAWKAPLWQQ